MLLVLLVHCFCEYSCFEINSMTEKFNSVLPKLLCPLSFCYNQEPFTRKSQLRDGENFVNTIISCSADPQLILEYIKPQDKFLNLVLLNVTFFIQFRFQSFLRNSYSPWYRIARIGRVAFLKNLKPCSPVTSIKVTIIPKSFLTFSCNPFATLV